MYPRILLATDLSEYSRACFELSSRITASVPAHWGGIDAARFAEVRREATAGLCAEAGRLDDYCLRPREGELSHFPRSRHAQMAPQK